MSVSKAFMPVVLDIPYVNRINPFCEPDEKVKFFYGGNSLFACMWLCASFGHYPTKITLVL